MSAFEASNFGLTPPYILPSSGRAVPKTDPFRINEIITFHRCGTEDVEMSLEVLDKVLSEFEESDLLPPIIQPESPSQGHQSEDDGYMSMNGRRWERFRILSLSSAVYLTNIVKLNFLWWLLIMV